MANPQQIQDELRRRQMTTQERIALELAARQANTASMSVPSPVTVGRNSQFMPGGVTVNAPGFTPRQAAAARAGVDVNSGSPVGRFESGFAPNKEFEADFFQNALTEHFGQSTPVRIGQESGQIEFLNPETNRFTTINKRGMDTGDLKAILGPTAVVAPELLGAIGGAFLGSPAGLGGVAIGSAGLGASGAFLGELWRLKKGRELGVHDLDDDAILSRAQKTAGIALIGAGIGEAGGRLFNLGRRVLRGDAFRPDELRAAAQSFESQNQAIVNRINEVSETPFQPMRGQVSGDQTLLDIEAGFSSARTRDVRAGVRELQQQNETALEQFFDEVTPQSQVGSGRGDFRIEAGRETQTALTELPSERIRNARTRVRDVVSDAENQVSKLPILSESAAGRNVREMLLEARGQAKAVEDQLWKDIQTSYGVDPVSGLNNAGEALSNISVPASEQLSTTLRRLSSESANALFRSGRTAKGGLQIFVREGDSTVPLISVENGSMDLHQIQLALRDLRKQQRQANFGQVATDPSGRDVQAMINSLKSARAEALKDANPELLELIEQAEYLTRARAATFDRGFIGDLLRKGDNFLVPAEDVFFRVFSSNDSQAAQQIASLASASPTQSQEMRNTLFAIYRARFTDNGRPTQQLHRKFFERHGAVVDAFFSPTEQRQIRQLGELGRTIERKQAALENLERAWKNSFRGKIDSINSEELTRKFFTETITEGDVRKMRNLLQSSGNQSVWAQFQQSVGDELRRRISSTVRGRSFNERSIDNIIELYGPKLSRALGPEYVQNLKTLRSALEIARSRPPQTGREGPGILSLLGRVLLNPPLTQRGRAQTMIEVINRKAAERAMFEALSDPAKLNALIKSRNAQVGTVQASRIMAMLGATSLTNE